MKLMLSGKNIVIDIPDGMPTEDIEAEIGKYYTPDEMAGKPDPLEAERRKLVQPEELVVPTTFAEREAYRADKGRSNVETGKAYWQALNGEITYDAAKSFYEERTKEFNLENDELYKAQNWPEKFVGATTELAPYMLDSVVAGAAYGQAVGGGVATMALASGLGAPAALPLYLGGVAVGQSWGTLENAAEVEGGAIYSAIRDNGGSHEDAKMWAVPAGYLIGAIELWSLERLFGKFIPGLGRVGRKGITDFIVKKAKQKAGGNLAKAMGKVALTLGKAITKETAIQTGEEVLQQGITSIAEVGEALVREMNTGEDYTGPTSEEIKTEFIETIKQSLLAFPLMGLPTSIHTTLVSHGREALISRILTQRGEEALNLDLADHIAEATKYNNYAEFSEALDPKIDDKYANNYGFDNRTLLAEASWNASREVLGEDTIIKELLAKGEEVTPEAVEEVIKQKTHEQAIQEDKFNNAVKKSLDILDGLGIKIENIEMVDEEIVLDPSDPMDLQVLINRGMTEKEVQDAIKDGKRFIVTGEHSLLNKADQPRRQSIRFFRGATEQDAYHEILGHGTDDRKGLVGFKGTNEQYAKYIEDVLARNEEDAVFQMMKDNDQDGLNVAENLGDSTQFSIRTRDGTDIDVEEEIARLQQIKENPKVIKAWEKIYAEAKTITPSQMIEVKGEKLTGVPVVHLTKNCQRINFIKIMKRMGVLPQSYREVSCYASKGSSGACYKDRFNFAKRSVFHGAKIQKENSISEKPIGLATKEDIRKMLSNPKYQKIIKDAEMVRLGQAGDDSHAVYLGLVEELLKVSKELGVKPKQKYVFVTSGYAPTTAAMYQRLTPYKSMFVIHISESGYFSHTEILNRFNEFAKASNAGLNAKMRVITNKDQISAAEEKSDIKKAGPMRTREEGFLFALINSYDLNNILLETPFHNDFHSGRSAKTELIEKVCCETKKCATCGPVCLIKQRTQKPVTIGTKGLQFAIREVGEGEIEFFVQTPEEPGDFPGSVKPIIEELKFQKIEVVKEGNIFQAYSTFVNDKGEPLEFPAQGTMESGPPSREPLAWGNTKEEAIEKAIKETRTYYDIYTKEEFGKIKGRKVRMSERGRPYIEETLGKPKRISAKDFIAQLSQPKGEGEITFKREGDAVGKEYHETIYAVDPKTNKTMGFVKHTYLQGESSVQMIEVKPEYRRQGVGLKLLNELQSQSKKPITLMGDVVTKEGRALFDKFLSQPKGEGFDVEFPQPQQAVRIVPALSTKGRIRKITGITKADSLIKETEALKRLIREKARITKALTSKAGEEERKLLEGAIKQLVRGYEREDKLMDKLTIEQFNREADKYLQERVDALRKKLVDYAIENLPKAERGAFLNAVIGKLTEESLDKQIERVKAYAEKAEKASWVRKIKQQVKRIAKSKSLAIDYVQRIQDFISEYELKGHSEDTLNSLKETKAFLEREADAGREVSMPLYVLKSLEILARRPLSELEAVDLEDISVKIGVMADLGKVKLRSRRAADKLLKGRDLIAIGKDSKAVNSKKLKEGNAIIGKLSVLDTMMNSVKKVINLAQMKDLILTPVDAVFDYLDNSKGYLGANYRIFKRRIDVAHSLYKAVKFEITQRVDNKANELNLNRDNMERIGLHAARAQKGGMDKLLSFFTQEQIDSVVLTKEETEFYDYLRNELDILRPQIEKIMREVYNAPLAVVENYFPFLTDFEAMSDKEVRDRFGDNVITHYDTLKSNVDKKFTMARKGGKNKIKINAAEVFGSHLDNALYLIHVGKETKYLGELARTEEYGEAVGDVGQEIVREWIDLIARKGITQGQRVKLLDVARNYTGLVALGLKLSSTLVQVTALMDGAALIGGYSFQGFANVLTDGNWRAFVMANMPEIRDRVGDDPAFQLYDKEGFGKSLNDIAFWPLKTVDKLAATGVAVGAYIKYMNENNLEIDLNNPDPDGIAYAQKMTRRTQSSSNFKDLPLAITKGKLTGNISLDKILLQFQSFMLNRWSLIRHDLWRAGIKGSNKKQAINIAMWLIAANYAELGIRKWSKEAITRALGKEIPEDDEEKQKLADIGQILQNIPFLGSLYYSLLYGDIPVPAVSMGGKILVKTGTAVKKSFDEDADSEEKERKWLSALLSATPGGGQFRDITKEE